MVRAALSPAATEFINSVIERKPGIAVFDCDGTLWSGDSGADFFYWEIERGLVPRDVGERAVERYEEYKSGSVDEITICGEMVTIHRGLREDTIRRAAENFFVEVVEDRIFPEMKALCRELAKQGCELWAVSSTNNWVVAEGAKRFGIPEERILAACVHFDDGVASDRLHRVPSDHLKAEAIEEVIARPVDAVFGNSIHDLAMMEIAKLPYAVNPNPDLERIARERDWTIYKPGH